MTSLSDYFKWRGDLLFSQAPINEVDAMIFTQLCYLPYDDIVSRSFDDKGITIKQYYEGYIESRRERIKIGALLPNQKILVLLKYAARSRRFSQVRMRAYVKDIDLEHEKQFCAISFDINDDTTFVCFSGTDDTIVGWKENFNMALFTPIPAQTEGVEYLNKLGADRNIYVGGHSKGGNLAIYASFMSNLEVQNRIITIYNFDGPGFKYDFLKDARKNHSLAERVINLLPESTIVGAIFDTIGKRIYIKSKVKGFQQHDLFTWYLEAPNTFVRVETLAKASIQFHNMLEQWVADMTTEQKVQFIEAFYKLCKSNDSDTLTDIMSNKAKFAVAIFNVDEKSKKILWKTMAGSVVKGYFVGPKKKPVTITVDKNKRLQKVSALEAEKKKPKK